MEPRYSYGGDEYVFVELDEAMSLQVNFRATAITNRLREERIPGVTDICPSNASYMVRVNPDVLHPDDLISRLRELDEEVGEAREKLAAKSESSEEFRISFNPGYLIDGVTAVDTEDVVFRLNESLKPGLIVPGSGENGDGNPGGGEEPDFLYLIMPMRDPYGE